MMNKLILGSEYMADPIFCPDPDGMGHISVDDLPLSPQLRNEIRQWDAVFQNTFNADYPPDSKFSSDEAERHHIERGRAIALLLQQELGDNYEIVYYP